MWLSKFLSVEGVCVCTHEATEFAGSASEFWTNGEHFANGREFYGNSDSANIFVLPALLAEMPMTRVIWVARPVVEVAKSMKAAGMLCNEKALRTLIDLREKYWNMFDLMVGFRDLQHMEICKGLWEFCLPGVPFDYGRWGRYANRRICYSKEQPFPRKNYDLFLPWVLRELEEVSV